MRPFTLILSVVLASLAAPFRQRPEPIPADKICEAQVGFVGSCFTARGRMRLWQGAPARRIWKIGTNRVLGVEDEALYGSCAFPKDLRQLLDRHLEIYADFVVRPRTTETPGVMQRVCVQSALHVMTRRAPSGF